MLTERILRWLACVIALSVSGCASFNPEIGDMTRAYSAAIERHEMNQILKNILRAADGLPMRFQAVPTIIGTGSLEGSAGATGRLLGGFMDNSTTTNSLKSTRGFNFNLASLDNEKFTSAFLGDLSLETINVISSGGFHRDLLFTLVLHDITVKSPGKPDLPINNRATSRESFERFQSMLSQLTRAGLRTESYFRLTSVGVDLTRDEMLERFLGSRLAAESDIRTIRLTTPQGDRYRIARRGRATRLCLSPERFLELSGLRLNSAIECRAPDITLAEEALRSSRRLETDDAISFNLRSTRDVYHFVGQLAMAQHSPTPWVPTIELPVQRGDLAAGKYPLMVIRKGEPGVNERVLAVAEHMGTNYFIPYENSGLSAWVLDYLSVLLSISLVKDAIPASPGILVR